MDGDRATRMVGREPELAIALDAIDRVAAATGNAVLIEGEAGIGKTQLLEEVLRAAGDGGSRVLRGSGRQMETAISFAPFVEALGLRPGASDDRRAAIAELLAAGPVHRAGPTEPDPQRQLQVIQSIVDLIEDELAGEGPLVLALEDAHWMDGASLAVVDRLVSRLVHVPLLILLTTRPYPRSAELDGVVDRMLVAGATHLRLRALDEAAVAELSRRVLGAAPGPRLVRVVAAAGGNPLFLTELLAALREEGSLEVGEGAIDVTAERLPPPLRLTVLRRLSILPTPTVDLLRSAAVLGTAFDVRALAALVDQPELVVVDALQPARRSGVVRERDGGVGFGHDLVRDAVYEDMPESVRRALHATAARRLDAAGYEAEVVAPHLLRASLTGSDPTLARLRSVASELIARAPDLAVDLLRCAADLAPSDHQAVDEIRLELATALSWAQRTTEATAIAGELVRDLDAGPLRRTALALVAVQAQHLGGMGRYRDDLESAAAEPDAGPRERARLLALATTAALHGDQPQDALGIGERAMAAAEESGDEVAMCGTLLSLAGASDMLLELERAITFARRAVALGRASRDPELHRVLAPEVTLANILGNYTQHRGEAIQLARDGLARAEERRLAEFAVTYQLLLGVNLWRAGRLEEAGVELEAGVERALETGRAASTLVELFARLARISVHRDDFGAAQDWLARVDAALDQHAPGFGPAVHLALARAELLAATGDACGACEVLVAAWSAIPDVLRPTYAPLIGPPLARFTAATDEAMSAVGEVAAVIVDDGRDPAAPWLRGLVESDVEVLLHALERARDGGTWLRAELPQLCEDTGSLLAAAGDPDQAVGLLEEAVSGWEEMGAVRDVSRVEARLRELGVHRGRRGRRRRPATGWAALTPTEQRVVELIAEGLIYREVAERMFISRRTVETHVAHVFAKLDLANRRELELAYAERQRSRAR